MDHDGRTVTAWSDVRMPLLPRLLGAAAHLGAALLWGVLLFANPYGNAGLTTGTYALAALMVLVGLTGTWASVTARPRLMTGLFVLTFIPVGLYLAGTPGWFRWIAVLNLTALLAALLLARQR